jgi:mannose-6-phosphate isomerase
VIDPEVRRQYEALAAEHGLNRFELDDRPWGGEFIFDDQDVDQFVASFFRDLSVDKKSLSTPKFLLVAPHQRFSWQYHERRGEVWAVLGGPVGLIESATDDQPPLRILEAGAVVEMGPRQRHRLAGLDGWGAVAELWRHVDMSNPSTEDDNTRLEDDYQRH